MSSQVLFAIALAVLVGPVFDSLGIPCSNTQQTMCPEILLATHKISFCLCSLNASCRMVIQLLPGYRCYGERKQVSESVRMRKLKRLCLDRVVGSWSLLSR